MIEKINLQLAEFDNEKDRLQAIADLTHGIKSNFWRWLEGVIDVNIELTQKTLFNDESLTNQENNLLKKHLKALKQIKELPHKQLETLNGIDNEEYNKEHDPDPYEK